MEALIARAFEEGFPVEIIYLSNKQKMTQRTVLVRAHNKTLIRAYCFLRQQTRLFKIENILSIRPIKQKEEPFIS